MAPPRGRISFKSASTRCSPHDELQGRAARHQDRSGRHSVGEPVQADQRKASIATVRPRHADFDLARHDFCSRRWGHAIHMLRRHAFAREVAMIGARHPFLADLVGDEIMQEFRRVGPGNFDNAAIL
ncbi:hypothetical protein [Methylocystis sp.]|uniref:hypothetical protein n=1 Tax=Methylocystis sp. TaxID=1911079 RepID=UPI003DA2E106